MTRRLHAAILVSTALALLASGCSAAGAQPTPSGANYVGADSSLTRIPPADRKPAPVVSGPALGSGKSISTADYRGKVVVLNAWASWCAPCRKEAPDLQRASAATRKRAQFVGINTRDSPAGAEAFLRAERLTYPSVNDVQGTELLKFSGTLPLTTLPSTVIVDRQGRMAVRIVGAISARTLIDLIDDTAAGR